MCRFSVKRSKSNCPESGLCVWKGRHMRGKQELADKGECAPRVKLCIPPNVVQEPRCNCCACAHTWPLRRRPPSPFCFEVSIGLLRELCLPLNGMKRAIPQLNAWAHPNCQTVLHMLLYIISLVMQFLICADPGSHAGPAHVSTLGNLMSYD